MSFRELLTARRRQAEAEAERHQADAARRATEARALEDAHRRLEQDVQKAERRLVVADQQFTSIKAQAKEAEQVVRDTWGLTHGGDDSPLAPPVYARVVALNTAITDYPRVRETLAARAESARLALRTFERQHAR
jgi:chromosome segregation ATPase